MVLDTSPPTRHRKAIFEGHHPAGLPTAEDCIGYRADARAESLTSAIRHFVYVTHDQTFGNVVVIQRPFERQIVTVENAYCAAGAPALRPQRLINVFGDGERGQQM